MRLTKGNDYDLDSLRLYGWTDGVHTESHGCYLRYAGYRLEDYFDVPSDPNTIAGARYLGPDEDGVEPIVEVA